VPGAAIRVDGWIGRFGDRAVGLAPRIGPGCPVDRRADQRMPEHHSGTERDQAIRFDGLRGRLGDAEPLRGPPHQRQVADRVGRGHEQQAPRTTGEPGQPPGEALLDPGSQGQRRG